jgi:hypothetical protein
MTLAAFQKPCLLRVKRCDAIPPFGTKRLGLPFALEESDVTQAHLFHDSL